ncbi:endocuticle structural glycoprotein SgAbd-5-like [Vanessa atalanta]|uniref:endocuticle structural glycoprotein SgAbd-5-like n=1 Tax=Vanessa atalanta TaxID=42275 RepID=UPI001FCDE707|nr:endocuticle structural glycoprotein SgAbd-5-like [Vanessa atalanta]
MKTLVILVCAAIAAAAPPAQRAVSSPQGIQIVQYDSDNDGLGNYNYNFELSDGTKRDEQGELRNAGAENEFIAVRGSYSWVDPDGVSKTVLYIADDKGFQPMVEQGPGGPVPIAVIKALLNQ